MLNLLVGGLRVTPAHVVLDRAGEQDVLLQDDGDRVAQRAQVIVAHVAPADLDGSLGDVVEAADQLNE